MLLPTDVLNELFQSILRDIMIMIDAPDGHISLFDKNSRRLIIRYGIGIYEPIIGEAFPKNRLLRKRFLKGNILFIKDYRKDFLRKDESRFELVTSMIVFPLTRTKHIIGTYILSWRNHAFCPTIQDINLLQHYIALADIALESTRINKKLRIELEECNKEHNREEASHITKRKKLEVTNEKLGLVNDELELLSSIDHLTDTWNRRKFEQLTYREMAEVRRHQQKLSLLLLDIDHFKVVNDRFGHQIGDLILIGLTRLIEKNIRSTDYLTRWGGDEFAILLPHTSGSDAMELAEKIRLLIANTVFPVVGSVTVSIGVAEFEAEDNLETWMKRVDNALYMAKLQGRNMIIFVPPN